MIKILAGLTAGALLMTAAPAPTVEARDITPWDMCMIQATIVCYPRDGNGMIYLPTPGTPEGDAYDMCVAAEQGLCAGLPGDPNNP